MARPLLVVPLLMTILLSAAPARADDSLARELINTQGCKGCHRLAGEGGTVGPDLTEVGKRLTPEQIRQQLLDPKSRNSDAIMPAFDHLAPGEIDALVEFLFRQR
jgi:putative heme-binding domain-containing protein